MGTSSFDLEWQDELAENMKVEGDHEIQRSQSVVRLSKNKKCRKWEKNASQKPRKKTPMTFNRAKSNKLGTGR